MKNEYGIEVDEANFPIGICPFMGEDGCSQCPEFEQLITGACLCNNVHDPKKADYSPNPLTEGSE